MQQCVVPQAHAPRTRAGRARRRAHPPAGPLEACCCVCARGPPGARQSPRSTSTRARTRTRTSRRRGLQVRRAIAPWRSSLSSGRGGAAPAEELRAAPRRAPQATRPAGCWEGGGGGRWGLQGARARWRRARRSRASGGPAPLAAAAAAGGAPALRCAAPLLPRFAPRGTDAQRTRLCALTRAPARPARASGADGGGWQGEGRGGAGR